MRYILAALILSVGNAAFGQTSTVTFTKDVLPILQKNCQSCHRPGEIAPMSFLTYESTRPYARAIKAAVLNKTMPPWFADPQHGRFLNDRSLTSLEIETLVKWVDGGANAGRRPTPLSSQLARRMADKARCDRRCARIHHSIRRNAGVGIRRHPFWFTQGYVGDLNRDPPRRPSSRPSRRHVHRASIARSAS